MSGREHPIESTPGNAASRAASQPATEDTHERTFMGDIGLATRASLFVLIGLVVLSVGGFGLLQADRDLSDGRANLADAHELTEIVARIEAAVWRIRANGSTDTARLGTWLDDLYRRDDAGPVRDNISTLSEALAQYTESLTGPDETPAVKPLDLTGLEVALRTAARNIESGVAKIGMLSLTETIAAMRTAELAFIEDGASEPLAAIEGQWQEFSQLLSAMPLGEADKTSLLALMNAYQGSLTAYARARLARRQPVERGDEILSYMTPSIEGIVDFTEQNLSRAIAAEARRVDTYRTLIAACVAALILTVMLAGVMIIRSINSPVIAVAAAARRLAMGNADVAIGGLGNQDETGDIARAFSSLKQRLAETNTIMEALEKSRTEAEQGRAASAEAAWLRRDLESMKVELDKGKDAVAEVELLRAVIEATKADIASAHRAEPEPEPAPVAEPTPLDSISIISRRVAASSETVTQAALDAERTGILIRNLSDAINGVDGIEALIASIGEQAGMLVVDMGDDRSDLMVMQGAVGGGHGSDAVLRRFDIIRTAAGKATWAIRDIATVILEARKAALDLARSSSAEALDVTTELLEQSENLRGMLDQLVLRMENQLSGGKMTIRKETPDAS